MRHILFLWFIQFILQSGQLLADIPEQRLFPASSEWTSVNDKSITTDGSWKDDRFRFADAAHKYTTEHNASMRWKFIGNSVAVRLAGQNTSSYPGTGLPAHGKLAIYIDGKLTKYIYPAQQGREFIAANNLPPGPHELELRHLANQDSSGVRIEGFLTANQPIGLLTFPITAELQEYLNDVRIIVSREGKTVRSTIGRNWLTGQASISLPVGQSYDLRIEAIGWNSRITKTPLIVAGKSNIIPPVYLYRDSKTVQYRFRYPKLNNQAVRTSGEQFTARFLGFDADIKEVRIQRQIAKATFSRVLPFKEDIQKAFYYDRQIEISLPANTPPGVYDLEIDIVGGSRTGTCRSPSAVVVTNKYPNNPKFLTFGHLDTSGQYQAEYLQRIATMANIIGADMLLASNCVNPAYISGALSNLKMPHVVNFGNHQVYGHHRWYGPDLGSVTYGPNLVVLNYGLPWHESIEPVIAELQKHHTKNIKVINAFEHNAPISLLDNFKVALIHDAHGPGDKLMKMGQTPTQRVGKSNSVSFRLVEFGNGQVVSATYHNHPTAPIPFGREQQSPLRVERSSSSSAMVINEFDQTFENAQITFVVPNAKYTTTAGRVKSIAISDDDTLAEVIVTMNIKSNSKTNINLIRQ